MGNLRRDGLIWVLACIGIAIPWGTSIARGGRAWMDFRCVYACTRCLIHQHNPYNADDVEREYQSEDGQRPPAIALKSITLYVYMPTTLVFVAPFAALSWGPAHILWMLLTGCVLVPAILLMWDAGASQAPRVSTWLACIIALNCATFFAGGNSAGIVVGLCGIAVWCFLHKRFVGIGVLCFALSLAVKPHDVGFVWLYFVLVGGAYRKRALQSALIAAVIGLVAVLWVSHVAPHWMHDWNANLATMSARGGVSNPGPSSFSTSAGSSIVDLQAALSVFRDDPRFYNIASYAFCGTLLLVWCIWTLRTRFTVRKAWLGLAAVTAFTLLITYHRLWDAKLVMLAIPACCLLWAEGGYRAKAAVLIASLAALLTGDATFLVFEMVVDFLRMSPNGILGQAATVVLKRPATFALLAMGVFYLWTYLRADAVHAESVVESNLHAG